MSEEDIIEEKKKKLILWLKNPYNFALAALMLFTLAIYIHNFSLTANQPTWWDEGDYLALAQEIAHPSIEKPEWWDHFIKMRPPLMPLIWAVFLKLGLNEPIMRFLTEVLPAILLVYFSYLLASSLYNRKVGLITGYMISIYWVIQFYSMRFMTDIPAMLFAVMSGYFFWEFYLKREKSKGLYLAIIFGVLGFLTRFPTAIVTLGSLFFLLLITRYKFFLKREVWIAGFIGLVTLIPYFIYNQLLLGTWFPAGSVYGDSTIIIAEPAWFLLFGTNSSSIFQFIKPVFTILFAIGLMGILYETLTSLRKFFKRESKSLDSHIYLLIWLLFQMFFFIFVIKSGNDRWILLWTIPIFIFGAVALNFCAEIVASYSVKYRKLIYVVIVLAVMILAGISHLNHSNYLIEVKLPTYKDVQDTGLWLKENSAPGSKILGASIVQNYYYAQRSTYDFYLQTEFAYEVTDYSSQEGTKIAKSYEAVMNETELECKIDKIKPDYMILHVWEPAFTPQFMYTYAERNPGMLEPVMAYQTNGQTTAVIYKFLKYPQIDSKKVNCTWVLTRLSWSDQVALLKKTNFPSYQAYLDSQKNKTF